MNSPLQHQALHYLRQALDDPRAEFRDGQWEAIERLVNDRVRLLVVQRTGWGKSIVYFLATRLFRDRGAGPTLLISPLLSLMRNQIQAAERIGIGAKAINSTITIDEENHIKVLLKRNEVDVLLITPERLANEIFMREILFPISDRIGLFVVDEAHCISDWGHEFRPDYRRIVRILQALPPNIPVLATTATANDRVVDDVLSQLGDTLQVMRGSLARTSLRLQNISLPSQAARMAWLVEQLPLLQGSGIIYVLTVRDAERLTLWLQSQGIDAHAYHSELDTETKETLEQNLLENRLKALVATTALGMGFDKPDLGFVIHYQRPGSVVHYYQQVGRAGRATREAYGILLSGNEDQEIVNYFIQSAFPPEAHVGAILAALNEADDGLSVPMLQERLNLRRGQIEKVLKMLAVESPAPLVYERPRWSATPVQYVQDQSKVKKLIQIRQDEQTQMTVYTRNRECLMAFLQEALDDPDPRPCGLCAVCLESPLLPEYYSPELAKQAAGFLRRLDLPIEPRRRWIGDALAESGWRGIIPIPLRAEEGRALSFWGDAGWGEQVKYGKQRDGRFSDDIVSGAEELIVERWRPSPTPAWVTCVPSLNQVDLVPDFAQRLATKLGIPFVACIQKVRRTTPQKEMNNSYQQARNLAEAFVVHPFEGIHEPGLLIDDVVDSRWTFTVIAALLREAGSGPIFPFALAQASKDLE